MIILTETTDSLQVVLDAAVTTNQLKCMASWRDIVASPASYTPGRTVTDTNDTTDVDIVAPPAGSTQRVVDFISIFNTDTVNATVIVKFDANGTEYTLFRTTLAVNEKLEYQEGQGFKVFANSGAVKQSINQGNNTVGSTLSTVVLGSDVVNNNAVANTIADVTGLSFSVVAGSTYYFQFIIPYTAAATTTGSRWSINGPAGIATWCSEYSLTGTTTTRNANVLTYDLPAASNATSASTTNNMAIIEGYILPSANGTVIARFASEVLSSAITAKAGAVCYYQQLN
jgi:hypothetical protein